MVTKPYRAFDSDIGAAGQCSSSALPSITDRSQALVMPFHVAVMLLANSTPLSSTSGKGFTTPSKTRCPVDGHASCPNCTTKLVYVVGQIQEGDAEDLQKSAERREARSELRATESKHEAVVADAKSQLAGVEAEHTELKQDVARMQQELNLHHANSQSEQRIRTLEAEALQLSELRESHEMQIEQSRREVLDLRRRLEELAARRAQVQQETGNAADATRSLATSLEDAKRQLQESEEQRWVLRRRYQTIGEQFEKALAQSEDQSHKVRAILRPGPLEELEAALTERRSQGKEQRQRLQAAELQLAQTELAVKETSITLQLREEEVCQWQRSLETERKLGARRVAWQQQLAEETQMKPAMVPVPLHEKLLEDQARFFQDRLAEMEKRFSTSQPAPKQSVGELTAELAEVRALQEQAEARHAAAEQKRCVLAESLAEAGSNISRLQQIVDEVFSGTPNPQLVIDEAALTNLQHHLRGCNSGGSALGRTNVTVGYRGFWVEGAGSAFVVRGCQAAEVLLLSILRPSISETVANYIRDEIARDHTGELDLPDLDGSAVETAANCSHQVGPDTVPTYNPSVDDRGCFVSHQSQNNCYNYGTDISTDTFAQPGRGSGHKWKANTCDAIRAAAESDGLQWQGTELPKGPPETGHFVALFIWPDTNFHWVRMDKTGFWSHKPGGTPVRNTDNNGQQIRDPSKSDFSPWSQFCGYMHVVPSVVQSHVGGTASVLIV
ncbi:unnamed protein product [Symbiodinium sp. CCMP2592]|nr:unnamed protein product [Symbiodinium sp. CCMP2592]